MIRSVTTVALAAALSSPLSAQTPGEPDYRDVATLPEGPVGRRITALIETLNAADTARVRRFFEEEATSEFRDFASMERHQQVFASMRRQWGAVRFHGIRTYDPPRPDQTVVIVQDENFGAWRALTLRFDDAADHRVSSLQFNDASTPSNVNEPALDETALVEEVRTLLARVCERDVFSGTALVARGEEVLLTHACGEASKRFHVPNDVETKFNLGSMNKMFTSVAILQLVERDVLRLDEPIGRYVDESWLPPDITDRVTIHHLLSHTSGLGSYFNDTFMGSSRARFRELADYKPLVQGDTLAFEPGTDWQYSNTGMFLLGVVIEAVTGQSYFDYIREHIYALAGMNASDSYDMDQPVENLAIGYDPAPETPTGWENNLFKHVIRGGPAGGGFSTVGDLHRFAVALQAGRLVSTESLETLWTDYAGETYGYGYGFAIEDGPNGKIVGHSGGFPGISANLDIMLDRGYMVAVLSNYGGAAPLVANRLAALIARVPGERMQ